MTYGNKLAFPMKALYLIASILAWGSTAYLCSLNDVIGSYPVYYIVVFIALGVVSSVLSAFISTGFYYQVPRFIDVFFRVLPLVSVSILGLTLLAYSPVKVW